MQPLNADTLASFRDFMQPDELLDFVRRVQEELAKAWPLLQENINRGEWDAVQKEAHRLKSVAGSVGCDALHEALHHLERGLRAHPPQVPDARERQDLGDKLGQALQALRQFTALS